MKRFKRSVKRSKRSQTQESGNTEERRRLSEAEEKARRGLESGCLVQTIPPPGQQRQSGKLKLTKSKQETDKGETGRADGTSEIVKIEREEADKGKQETENKVEALKLVVIKEGPSKEEATFLSSESTQVKIIRREANAGGDDYDSSSWEIVDISADSEDELTKVMTGECSESQGWVEQMNEINRKKIQGEAMAM